MEAGIRISFGCIFLLFSMINTAFAIESIMGRREPCSNEGEEVAVDTIKDMTCFKCICQNGFVECESQNCPAVDDCYMLEKKDGCCDKCKDCIFKGQLYASGSEWTDPDSPCDTYKCVAGVVTESTIQCYTTCNNPLRPRDGECCPTCLGCHLNGQVVSDGREVQLSEDPCLKCSCSNKRLTCMKKACPVLQCPPSKQVKMPGECCPKCKEKRVVTTVPGKCILGTGFHANGQDYKPDICSHCTCVNGTSICKRNTCPVLECEPESQKTRPGECCPHCPPTAESKSTCTYQGIIYQNNETWNLDSCRSCRCHSGAITCAQVKCAVLKCRPNQALVTPPGQCCSKCEESAGTCTVFGDPHYKTFDGKFFSFQGSCKYQLTADCVDHSFSIRVTNDGRNTKSSSWTKTVTLKMGTVKVTLGQKRRVKVNGTRIFPPYKLGSTLDIKQTDEGINVITDIGIQLLWDGNNFLQVQADVSYKKKLCGLCGNYNNIWRDDLTARRGINYSDEEVWRFANSWKVGGIKACARKHENLSKTPLCRHKKGPQYCRPLKDSDIFASCIGQINSHHYYESCRKDMCECPSGKCHCDNFAAYVHECKRLGYYVLDDWRQRTGCDENTALALRTPVTRRRDQEQLAQRRQRKKKQHNLPPKEHNAFLERHVPKNILNSRSQHDTEHRTPPPLH